MFRDRRSTTLRPAGCTLRATMTAADTRGENEDILDGPRLALQTMFQAGRSRARGLPMPDFILISNALTLDVLGGGLAVADW